jgi:hypothetical protein
MRNTRYAIEIMAHRHEILILAVTRMRGGVCVAGMSGEADPLSGLRWVRPVKQHGLLLLGDIRYASGAIMRTGDVVDWRMGLPQPSPPHIEDVLVDPIRDRPQLLRRLDRTRLVEFCAGHLDRAPTDVLDRESRSLCLLRPVSIRATWTLDPYSGHYEARIAFQWHDFATDDRGIPATDLAWRALGRMWLQGRERLALEGAALRERLGDIYLAIGRGRLYAGRRWPLIVGVHAAGMPEVEIDEETL